MEYLIYTVIALVAGRIGWKIHEMWVIYIIREHPERMELALKVSRTAQKLEGEVSVKDLVKEATKTEMSIERVNNTLYAYAKDSGQFLAQGATVEDICSVVQKRFPNKTFFGDLPQEETTK